MPYWLIGPLKGGGSMTVGFDIDTGKLTAIRDPLEQKPIPVDYNLATIQGGGEVMFELVPLLGRKRFCHGLAAILPPHACTGRHAR
jgi:hypothetical protein